MKNDLPKLPKGSRAKPFRLCHCVDCGERDRPEQETRRFRILSRNPAEGGARPEAKPSSAGNEVAGFSIIFIAALVALIGAVLLLLVACATGKVAAIVVAFFLALASALLLSVT